MARNTINGLQLALFLENLEYSFMNMSLANLTEWGITRYPNDTIQVIEKVVAVSES
jgi:hypothetical protein